MINEDKWNNRKLYIDNILQLRNQTLDEGNFNLLFTKNVCDNNQYQELIEENNELRAKLNTIYNSRGWRYLNLAYKFKDFLIPQKSIRYKVVRKCFRALRFIKRTYTNLNWKNIRKCMKTLYECGPKYTIIKVKQYNNNFPNGRQKREITLSNKIELSEQLNIMLNFKEIENPKVSIIIPVYNQWKYTYNCLKSILETSEENNYEIIVADDGSSDGTRDIEETVTGIVYIKNDENLGFLKNCNNAAKKAKGEYLLFLNNDTVVLNEWLSSLINLMEDNSQIGMAGSKLLYPDMTLQEAGGIIWNDGTGLNYGRGDDPNLAQYNFVRDVDYLSGTSIIIRKQLWEEIGGFDERYSPAYCEDSDLAFEVRKHGKRVVYQPKSQVVHFERTSYGEIKENSSFEAMNKNIPKLLEKWKDNIYSDSFAPNENIYVQRDRSKYKRRVLFIDDYVPMFDQHAGGKTVFNFLQLFLDLGYGITFIGDNEYFPDQPYTEILQQMGIEVIYGQWYKEHAWEWMALNMCYFDIIFLNRPHIGKKYIDFFKTNTKAPVVYYGHDLHYLREMREYELTGEKALLKRSEKSKIVELDIMGKADIVFSVSPEEKKIIDKELGNNKTIVTPIFFYKDFDKTIYDISNKEGLIFVGGYRHTPNVDAVKWFVLEILPLIKCLIPGIKVTFAGSNPTEEILQLQSEDIIVTGYLSQQRLEEVCRKSRVCIIPLRFGAGIKGKTVDAMYNRMAIVSTRIGIEGLNGIDEYLKPYDTAEAFAKKVIELYLDENKIKEAYENNINYIKENLSYDSAYKLFYQVFGSGERI
ncbi:MAG: glycosyltransferase [Clostridiales bacterium]|jgi:GT2 family glycosyltransferase|nr:glycosyltransferase [Clostridiales bacterium]